VLHSTSTGRDASRTATGGAIRRALDALGCQ
jgi:hypothetical protein